jgi:putative endonuclease
MYYTYVLYSDKDKKLYYGYTTDLAQRFEQHRQGGVESTKDRRPLKLIYYESCLHKEDALQREKYFKTYRGRQFLQNRLKSYFTGLHPRQ